MQILSLNGAWSFREAEKGAWKAAEVPGCNYLDLLRLKEIPDPFDGTNEKDVYWVAQTDWEYQKEFDVPAELFSWGRTGRKPSTGSWTAAGPCAIRKAWSWRR